MIRVLGDRVLVALPPRETETLSAGGIVLTKDPDAAKAPTRGIVMALGEKVGTIDLGAAIDAVCDADPDAQRPSQDAIVAALHALKPAPFDVALGDLVLFPASAGDQFSDGGVDYVVLYEAEILGVCEPLVKDEAVA